MKQSPRTVDFSSQLSGYTPGECYLDGTTPLLSSLTLSGIAISYWYRYL